MVHGDFIHAEAYFCDKCGINHMDTDQMNRFQKQLQKRYEKSRFIDQVDGRTHFSCLMEEKPYSKALLETPMPDEIKKVFDVNSKA